MHSGLGAWRGSFTADSLSHRYELHVIGNGLANQGTNPDVEVDITKPHTVIRSQIAALKEMTIWLKTAHSGNEIIESIGESFAPASSSI